MSRTAVTLAKKHSGSWVLLCDPDVPLTEQNKTYRSFLLEKTHPDYCYVQLQESDGLFRRVHLRTPEAHEEHTAQLEKQNAEAVEAGKLEISEKEKRHKKLEGERAREHEEEINTINKGIEKDNAERAKTAKAKTAAADTAPKPGGPTIEDWVSAGYNPVAYPPQGFSEVDSPGLKEYKETGKITPPAPHVIPIIPAAGTTTAASAQAEATTAANASPDKAPETTATGSEPASNQSPSEAPKADDKTPSEPAAAAEGQAEQ